MLFNGEAIFGVVNLASEHEATRLRAEALVRRAHELGSTGHIQAIGRTYLGSVLRAKSSNDYPVVGDADEIHALVAGEFYNRSQSGQLFRDDPDRSRCVAEGYRLAGTEFFEHLDGTFAAAVWDNREERLCLLCDRRADARLFYRMADGLLVFSSWLQLLGGPTCQIDRMAVQEFLRFLYIAPPRTIYENISCVEVGSYLTACRSALRLTQFKPVTSRLNQIISKLGPGETLIKFDELLQESVRRRIGYRRVGMFLSSGADSSTLTAVCQRVNPGEVEAFTVGFEDADLDESRTARRMADHIGVPHTELRFGLREYRRAFELMVREFEQPFGDPAALPLLLACESAKNRVQVISGGVGGDDLFGSRIPRHLRISTVITAKLPPRLRLEFAAFLNRGRFGRISSYTSLFDFDDVEELFVTWTGWRKQELERLIGESVSFAGSGFYRAFRDHRSKGVQELFNALGLFPPDDARFETAALAQIPIEMPYHDVDLNSFVRNLPERYRYCDGSSKILLLRLFKKYFPEQFLSKKKHYFNIPLQGLLADSNYDLVRHYLAPQCVDRAGLVDYSRARQWIDRFLAGDETLRFKIWAFLVLHAWAGSRN